MIIKLLIGFLLCGVCSARAEGVMVRSPDRAQTYAFSSILDQHLRQFPRSGELAASVTVSNVNYYSRSEPKQDERFDFTFPGVRFDRGKGAFYLPTRAGGRLPVAAIHRRNIGRSIDLLPNARITIVKRSGAVEVILEAKATGAYRENWLESSRVVSLRTGSVHWRVWE